MSYAWQFICGCGAAAITVLFLGCSSDSAGHPDGGGENENSTGESDSADAIGDSDSIQGREDSDSDSGDTESGSQSNVLTGIIRDFHASHPDFEATISDDRGIVELDLGADGKPVYAGGDGTVTTSGADNFNTWYNDVADVNLSVEYTLILSPSGDGVYTYTDGDFFPIDDQLFGNEGNIHNYHFTFELHTKFTYKGGEEFGFTGDDDLFVFINGRLALDLGGIHGEETQTVNLDDAAETLGITVGSDYPLDFFFAERHTSESNFRIDTTISNLGTVIIK